MFRLIYEATIPYSWKCISGNKRETLWQNSHSHLTNKKLQWMKKTRTMTQFEKTHRPIRHKYSSFTFSWGAECGLSTAVKSKEFLSLNMAATSKLRKHLKILWFVVLPFSARLFISVESASLVLIENRIYLKNYK